MTEREALTRDETAHLRLLEALEARGYDFVTITPESHRRVLARETMRQAKDLRGVFGWSLPFADAEARRAFAERMRREAFDTPITDEQRAADRQLLADAKRGI